MTATLALLLANVALSAPAADARVAGSPGPSFSAAPSLHAPAAPSLDAPAATSLLAPALLATAAPVPSTAAGARGPHALKAVSVRGPVGVSAELPEPREERAPDPLRRGRRTDVRWGGAAPPLRPPELVPDTIEALGSAPDAAVSPRGGPPPCPGVQRTGFRSAWSSLSPPAPSAPS